MSAGGGMSGAGFRPPGSMETRSPLVAIRQTLGLTMLRVAAAAGTSTTAVARIERLDVGTMRVETLVKIAQALGVAVSELVPALNARPRAPRRIGRGAVADLVSLGVAPPVVIRPEPGTLAEALEEPEGEALSWTPLR